MDQFYSFINFAIPIVLLFFVGFLMGKLLFFSENYKKIRISGSLFPKIFHFTIRLIAIVSTAIISAIISAVVLAIIGLAMGVYQIPNLRPTYGVPIYRPKIK